MREGRVSPYISGMASGMVAVGASASFDNSSHAVGTTEFIVVVVAYSIFGAAFGLIMSLVPWSLVERFDNPKLATDEL